MIMKKFNVLQLGTNKFVIEGVNFVTLDTYRLKDLSFLTLKEAQDYCDELNREDQEESR